MRRRDFLRHSVYATAALACPRTAAAQTDESIRVVVLEGAPRERGRQHGEGDLAFETKQSPDELIAAFLADTAFPKAMREWTPGLLEEIEGIAEGAGVKRDELFAFNCPDELIWYTRYRTAGMPLRQDDKCSALGVGPRDGRPTVIAQNMDIDSGSEGFEVLLHIKNDARETYLFAIAGMIGIVGMSNAPLGVVNNSLRQLDTRPDGLSVNAVVRGLLAQPDYEHAVDFIQRAPHATGHNYVIGGPKTVASFECSAHSVERFVSKRFPGCVYHTNHPFVNEDLAMHRTLAERAPELATDTTSSHARCSVIERHLAAADGDITADTFREILRSRENPELPVCRPHDPHDPGATFTAASLIMHLAPCPTLEIAPGPPSETPYKSFELPKQR